MHFARLGGALLVAASLGCFGGARSSAGSGTSEYTRQVQGYLSRLSENTVRAGFKRVVAGPVYGSLNDDAEATHEMTVGGGTDYVLFGACDNDCTDLDLYIYDSDGDLVRRDVETDDRPVLIFSSRKSGKFRIKVVMATCSSEPCRYGLQLNAK